jgi:hypothetical protein
MLITLAIVMVPAMFVVRGPSPVATTDEVTRSPEPTSEVTSPPKEAAITAGSIRIPTDASATYAVIAKGGTKKLPTLTTRREGSSGVTFAKRRFDCSAHTFMYLGEGDTLEEAERGRPDPKMSELTEGSISDYWWHYVCGK